MHLKIGQPTCNFEKFPALQLRRTSHSSYMTTNDHHPVLIKCCHSLTLLHMAFWVSSILHGVSPRAMAPQSNVPDLLLK